MARRDRLGLSAVRTEGAILPPSILARIHREDPTLGGLKPDDYDLSGTKIREAASQAWNALQGPWRAFQSEREKLAPGEAATGMTRRRWLDQILKALDYGTIDPLRESQKVGDREYPISHRFKSVPMHLVGCGLDLDKRTPGAVGASKTSPHGLVQLYLNAEDGSLWGFVSNGLKWRILRDSVSLSRQAMVEFDLETIFEGQLYDEFLLFYLVAHPSRVKADRPEECWLEKWSQAAGEEGKRALNTLRNGVEKAIVALGQGFLRYPSNRILKERLRDGSLDKQDYYRQLLRMVYRLLFLFVAEDRGLLLRPDADEGTKQLFTDHYGTQRLRLLAERLRGSSRHYDLYLQLQLVLKKLGEENGCPELGLPALGGFLFSEEASPDLDSAALANSDLLEAIRCLAVTEEGGRRTRVDYKNLASEEMGSVYESLLELHPELRSDGSEFALLSASGNERKTTGSYYTPDSLIQCLLDTALEPVVADRLKQAGPDPRAQEAAILALTVIDPAVGSGHFLIAAAHRLAKRLAQVRSGDDEPSPEAVRHALRDVIGKCLYGIDINPMSAELCKVALWMEALEPGKPLGFLDHHIQVGNALLGTVGDLTANGVPDEAFEPVHPDDKVLCKALRLRNEAEREGQVTLFEDQPKEAVDLKLWQRLDELPDDTLDQTRAIELAYLNLRKASDRTRLAADAWCCAFVQEKSVSHVSPRTSNPITTSTLKHLTDAAETSSTQVAWIEGLAKRYGFLHLHLAFPKVFASGGFDIVIGNPPYVALYSRKSAQFDEDIKRSAKLACYLNARIEDHEALSGRVNTFLLFLSRGSQIVARGGSVSYVLPDSFVTNESYECMRRALVATGLLSDVVTYSEPLFEGATVGTTLAVWRKGLVGVTRLAESANPTSVERSFSLSRGQLLSRPNVLLRIDSMAHDITLPGWTTLGKIAEVKDGINPGSREVRDRLLSNLPSDYHWKPVIVGGDIKPMSLSWGGLYVYYNPDAVTKEEKKAGTSLRDRRIFETKRIVYRQTAPRPIACICEAGTYALNSVHNVLLFDENEAMLEALCCYMNTATCGALYQAMTGETRKVFPQVHASSMRELPVPEALLDESSDLHRVAVDTNRCWEDRVEALDALLTVMVE